MPWSLTRTPSRGAFSWRERRRWTRSTAVCRTTGSTWRRPRGTTPTRSTSRRPAGSPSSLGLRKPKDYSGRVTEVDVGSTGPTLVAEGLVKRYGKTRALDGLDLEVTEGSVCGLLGPNGAGKTTAVRILSTLLRDRKSTRLNSSYANISYAVFCLKKKNCYPAFLFLTSLSHPLEYRHIPLLYSILSNLCSSAFFFHISYSIFILPLELYIILQLRL